MFRASNTPGCPWDDGATTLRGCSFRLRSATVPEHPAPPGAEAGQPGVRRVVVPVSSADPLGRGS